MKTAIVGVMVALSSLVGMSAYASDAASFKIHNESKYIISSFQTNEGSGWSSNWLKGEQIGAGEDADLKFAHDGPCEIKLRVSWRTTDGGQDVGEPWDIDICEAKNVYFDGDKVTFE